MPVQVGDKIRVLGSAGFYHYGVYVGLQGPNGEDVVHNDKSGGVELVHFEDFAAGRPVEIVQQAPSWNMQEEVLSRALSLLGTPYRLIDFNCEHFANYS